MHAYKSLFMVAGLGGVMLLMAGVLLKTTDLSRGRPGTPEAGARRMTFAHARERIRPRGASLPANLRLLRDAYGAGGSATARQSAGVKRALLQSRAFIKPGDCRLLQRELARHDNTPAYERVLIGLLGATRSTAAPRCLEALYPKHAEAVMSALSVCGHAESCEVLGRLYYEAVDVAEKADLMMGMASCPPASVARFAGAVLATEGRSVLLTRALSLCRGARCPESVEVLGDFLSSRMHDSHVRPLAEVAAMSLAAQGESGGADLLFEIHENQPDLRGSLEAAISTMIAPSAVQDLLTRLPSIPVPAPGLKCFLVRNAAPVHRPALLSFLKAHSDSVWAETVEAVLQRLDD